MQTYQKSQKQPTSHSCAELNKKQFFPASIVKGEMSPSTVQMICLSYEDDVTSGTEYGNHCDSIKLWKI